MTTENEYEPIVELAAPRFIKKPIEHVTVAMRVYQDLRELLMSGQLKPGQKLTLDEIATALGTSHTPVREAIRQLTAERVLEASPNKAVRVPVMRKERFSQLLQVRLKLEIFALESAFPNLTEEAIESLDRSAKKFHSAFLRPRPDIDAVIKHNKNLHFELYRLSRNEPLVECIESLWLQVGPVVNVYFRERAKAAMLTTGYHEQMIKGLRAGDLQQASEGLANDLLSAANVILSSAQLA